MDALVARREANNKWEQEGFEALGPPPSGVSESWIDITLPDGWVSRTAVMWPESEPDSLPGPCPLIVYFHGGGYLFGYPGQVGLPARGYAQHFRAVVACPSYKFTPENPFPGSVHSAWEVCAWLSDPSNLNEGVLKGTGVRVDPRLGFVVGGLSAGGNMAAVIGGIQALGGAASAEAKGLAPLRSPVTGIFASIPVIVHEDMLPERYEGTFRSREENSKGGGEGLTTAVVRDVERILQPEYSSPWYSPLNIDFSDPELRRRHPAKVFIQAGIRDPLRDDAVIYDKWLQETEVADSRVVVLEGMGHAAWISPDWPGSNKPAMRAASLDGMGWLLGREWDKTSESIY